MFSKYFWTGSSSANNDSSTTTPSDLQPNANKSTRVCCSCDDGFCLTPTGKQLSSGAKAVAAGAVAGGATGAAAVAAAVPVIQAAGFTANGIAAGSMAAGMMSSAATAAGGGVASGSTVAVCQSIGALGVLPGAIAAPVVLGAVAVGMAVPAAIYALRRGSSKQPDVGSGRDTAERCWLLCVEDERDVCVTEFDSEEEAREAFADAAASRILFSPDRIEDQATGVDSKLEVIHRVMDKHYFKTAVAFDRDNQRRDYIQQAARRSKDIGDRALAMGDFGEALRSFTDAITLHAAAPMTPSRLHEYHSCRAATLLKLGTALSALEDAEVVLRLRPDSSNGYLLKGEALTCLGRFSEALRAYTSGLAACDTTDVFQERLGELAHELARAQVVQAEGQADSSLRDVD